MELVAQWFRAIIRSRNQKVIINKATNLDAVVKGLMCCRSKAVIYCLLAYAVGRCRALKHVRYLLIVLMDKI